MERAWFYDRQGKPMTAQEYEATFEDQDAREEYRRVGSDIIIVGDEPCHVSTVWIGTDMGFWYRPDEAHLPIIFETMIFGGSHDQDCARYATEEQAAEGHARTVANLAAGRSPFDEEAHQR